MFFIILNEPFRFSSAGSTSAMASGLELDKLAAAIERFKGFSLFLSDSALVRLMTSLVALSMNNCALFYPLYSVDLSYDLT
jgi:hypothetical protein